MQNSCKKCKTTVLQKMQNFATVLHFLQNFFFYEVYPFQRFWASRKFCEKKI